MYLFARSEATVPDSPHPGIQPCPGEQFQKQLVQRSLSTTHAHAQLIIGHCDSFLCSSRQANFASLESIDTI